LAAASASSSAVIDPDALVVFPDVAVELLEDTELELVATLEVTTEPELKEIFLNLIGSKKLLSSTITKPSPEATTLLLVDATLDPASLELETSEPETPELESSEPETPELATLEAEPEAEPEPELEPYKPYKVLLVELTNWFLS